MSRWIPALLLRVLTALAATAIVAQADGQPRETWQVGGKTYSEVRVRESTPATVTIFHRGGITQLDLATLPPELQARFNYTPAAAQAWSADAAASLAASARLRPPPPPAAPPAPPANAPRASMPGTNTEPHIGSEVDLRPAYTNRGLFFKDQGRRPSCAVFAVVSALEYEIARSLGRAEPLSEEFLIWATRQLQPGIPLDDGYHFAEVVRALQIHGVPRLAIMPNTFGRKVTDISPPAEALADALSRREVAPVWFQSNDAQLVERIVDALNREKPVVIGLRWPNGRTLEGNHLLRDQKPVSAAGHAVTLIGYRCPDGRAENVVFIFRNSHGVNWGLGGCGFVAASYLRQHVIAAFYLTVTGED